MASAPDSNSSPIELPIPEESDSAEVVSCLEAASELWKSGQTREAIRSIQRGAEAAEQDGNDMRALKLARLGADLSAQAAASAAPAASDGSATPSAEPPRPAASAAPSPSHPANHPAARVSQPPPLPGASGPTPSPPSVAPVAKAKAKDKEKDKPKDDDKEDSAAASSGASADSSPASSGGGVPASGRSRAPIAERSSAKPSAPRAGLVASAPQKPSAPPVNAPPSVVAELVASGAAERVSVKRSALDANLLVVRPLGSNGAKAPQGTRQALLVYVDSESES
jgi:hypothetical protein